MKYAGRYVDNALGQVKKIDISLYRVSKKRQQVRIKLIMAKLSEWVGLPGH